MTTLIRYNTPTLFDRFLRNAYARPAVVRYGRPVATQPAVNVKETDAAYQLDVAVPGARKEQFTLNVHQNVLTITFKRAENTTEAFTRQEFGLTDFSRGFRLPKHVDAEQIRATYADGILRIELPKVEPKAVEPRTIAIA